jgi:hypothetical protein
LDDLVTLLAATRVHRETVANSEVLEEWSKATKCTAFPSPAAQPLRPIDKTFLIAEPMRKVFWTKCFAADGGSVAGWIG